MMSEKYVCEWYNQDKTIILIEAVDRSWSWDDAHEAIRQQQIMMRSVLHPVHTILDVRKMPQLPRQGAIPNFRILMNMHADNEELTIFVGSHSLWPKLLQIVGQVYGLRHILGKFRYVNTFEDAMTAIAEYGSHSNGTSDS